MSKIISKARVYIWAVTLACPLFLNGGDLSMYCLGTPCASPTKGEEWDSGMLPLVVRQVLTKGGGALVCVDSNYIRDAQGTPRLVFVKMPVLGLVDGASLPKTIYRCIGMFSYANTLGAEATIPAFEELSQKELDEIKKTEEKRAVTKDKARKLWLQKFDETLEIVKGKFNEAELADQSSRESYAKGLLANMKFGIANRILIERGVADAIVCKEKDYRVGRLEKLKAEAKWLDMLNLICEMNKDNAGRIFPSKQMFKGIPLCGMRKRIQSLIGDAFLIAKRNVATETGFTFDDAKAAKEIETTILSNWSSKQEEIGRFDRYPEIDQIQFVVGMLSNISVWAEFGVKEGKRINKDVEHRSLKVWRLLGEWDRMPRVGRKLEEDDNMARIRSSSREWEMFDADDKCGEIMEGVSSRTDEPYVRPIKYVIGDTNSLCVIGYSGTLWGLKEFEGTARSFLSRAEAHEIPPEDGEVGFVKTCQEAWKFIRATFVKFDSKSGMGQECGISVNAIGSKTAVEQIDAAEVKKDKDLLTKAMAGITIPASSKGNPQVRKIVKMMRDPTIAKIYEKYTGKRCEDEIAAFKSEWENVTATVAAPKADDGSNTHDEEIQRINNRIVELKELCHTWALRKRGLARTPPAVHEAEKEIKKLQWELSKVKMAKTAMHSRDKSAINKEVEEKRNAILKKYRDKITADLMATIDAYTL